MDISFIAFGGNPYEFITHHDGLRVNLHQGGSSNNTVSNFQRMKIQSGFFSLMLADILTVSSDFIISGT